MSDNIQDYDLKDELIAERKVGYFEQPSDMAIGFIKQLSTLINLVCWLEKLFVG